MQWLPPLRNYGHPPGPRRGHSLTRLLGTNTLVLFGGQTGEDTLLNDMYTFETSSSTWRVVEYLPNTPTPSPRHCHTATALSSTTLIIIGGWDGPSWDQNVNLAHRDHIDAWLYDFSTNTWTQLPNDVPGTPAMRYGHTTVAATPRSHSAALYVFGGFSSFRSGFTVHRLRILDWRWEAVPIEPATNPSTPSSPLEPARRENHSAVWSPELNAIVFGGGESDGVTHSDIWVLSAPARRSQSWTWRPLRVRKAGSFVHNGVGAFTSASMVLLPHPRPIVLIWGGCSSKDPFIRPMNTAFIVDVLSQQSVRVSVVGAPDEMGRALHATLLLGDTLYICGGVNPEFEPPCTLQRIKLGPALVTTARQAVDFGPVAADVARGKMVPLMKETVKVNSEYLKSCEATGGNQMSGPSSISVGTRFSGTVMKESEFGTTVSVVINGKVHRGVLLVCSSKKEETFSKEVSSVPQVEKKNAKTEDNALNGHDGSNGQGGAQKGPESIEQGVRNGHGEKKVESEDIENNGNAGNKANDVENGVSAVNGANVEKNGFVDYVDREKAWEEQVQATKKQREDEKVSRAEKERAEKRRRLEELAEELPDEVTKKTRVASVTETEVITLE